jgi:3'-phosphoadenosine 5'-phosphosulfate sulfotransferase
VPQLARIGADYGICCYSGGGFDGMTGKHDAAIRAAARSMPIRVLRIGDRDPSGEHMFTALAEGAVAEFERVAVTAEQVRTYRLPTAPAKDRARQDPRTP